SSPLVSTRCFAVWPCWWRNLWDGRWLYFTGRCFSLRRFAYLRASYLFGGRAGPTLVGCDGLLWFGALCQVSGWFSVPTCFFGCSLACTTSLSRRGNASTQQRRNWPRPLLSWTGSTL